MQVIGFCRFSYPAEGGFQIEHEDRASRERYLYAPHRMEERFRHFETICLPSLRAQTDPDFIFVILIGDSLPDQYRQHLERLTADMPQARIVARPPGPHRKVCQDVLNEVRGDALLSLQFRHDDDDAIARPFVERLKDTVEALEALVLAHKMVAFDWNRGYLVRPQSEGIAAEPIVRPYWGLAQAVAVRHDTHLSAMNFSHERLSRFMPTVTFTDEDMYARGHNDFNDSRQKPGVKPITLPLLDAAGEKLFLDRFGIDAEQVRAVFSEDG